MEDRELYQAILGFEAPWLAAQVDLREVEHAVHVWVTERPDRAFRCPECGVAAPMYDRSERRWRHLDTCQFTTVLCAQVPRIQCPTHGVKTVRVTWAEPGARFTLLFERLAIAWVREASGDGGAAARSHPG